MAGLNLAEKNNNTITILYSVYDVVRSQFLTKQIFQMFLNISKRCMSIEHII